MNAILFRFLSFTALQLDLLTDVSQDFFFSNFRLSALFFDNLFKIPDLSFENNWATIVKL